MLNPFPRRNVARYGFLSPSPRRIRRPVLEALEDRRLPSGLPAWLDAPWRTFDTGSYPQLAPNALAVGDLDGDGDVDAVVGRDFTGSFSNPTPGVSVLKNRGDGTYQLPVHYHLPAPPAQPIGEVALADVDGNGTLDVLATVAGQNGQGNRLAVWRNAGDGTLTGRAEFVTGPGPVGLVVADFTGDDFPDAATANYRRGMGDSTTVSLLVHNGLKGAAAAFLPSAAFTVGSDPLRLAAADLNGDGRIDLAVGRTDWFGLRHGTLTVLFNDGEGGFGAPTDYAAAPAARAPGAAVALADLDGDGDADLLGGGLVTVASLDYGAVTVRRNDGDGTFGPAESYRLDDWVPRPRHVTVADFDGDGRLDVVASTPNGRTFEGWNLLLNNGAGGFLPAVRYGASKEPFATAAADADRDGDLDVLAVGHDSAAVTVHLNRGGGVFPVLTRYEVGDFSWFQDAADLDRDGDLDLASTGSYRVYVLRNNGDGNFRPAEVFTPPRRQQDIKLRDLNRDGYPDLVLGPDQNFPPYHLVTALNRGDGTFAPGVVVPTFSCGFGQVEAGDFDNDGDNDVLLTEEAGCPGVPLPRIFRYRNDGAGNLTPLPPIELNGFARGGIAVADLNFDGNLDFVTGRPFGVGVFLGNGDMTFAEPLVSGTMPARFTLADLNRDGHLDVALIGEHPSFGTESVGVSLGLGGGRFAPAVFYPGASGLEGAHSISNDIDAADLTGDGYPEVLVSNDAPNDVSLFLNRGDGTLAPQQRYGVGLTAHSAVFADFSGDGVADVAALIHLGYLRTGLVLLRGLGANERPADVVGNEREPNRRPAIRSAEPVPASLERLGGDAPAMAFAAERPWAAETVSVLTRAARIVPPARWDDDWQDWASTPALP